VHNSEIIERDMSEMWTAGAFAHGPYARRGCLEPFIHPDVAALVHFDSCVFQAQTSSIRDAPGGNEDMGAFDYIFALRISHTRVNCLAGQAVEFKHIAIQC
jgi:hypothetical protein